MPGVRAAIRVRSEDAANVSKLSLALERIRKLHQEGVLSDSDFAQAKLKLLKIKE